MTQTYTKQFQCEYKLQRYPFDTQVTIIITTPFPLTIRLDIVSQRKNTFLFLFSVPFSFFLSLPPLSFLFLAFLSVSS